MSSAPSTSIHQPLQDAAERMQPMRWYRPLAWQKEWRALLPSTEKLSCETKTVPLVPSEMVQSPSCTLPVPIAAAALSPAPAATVTSPIPQRSAYSFFKRPADSYDCSRRGSCSRDTPHNSHIYPLQSRFFTSSKRVPDASE